MTSTVDPIPAFDTTGLTKKQIYMRQYRYKNREKIREYLRLYVIANKEKLTTLKRQYYQKNREKFLKWARLWDLANKEKKEPVNAAIP